jgi:predicted nucleic acid-binding protein
LSRVYLDTMLYNYAFDVTSPFHAVSAAIVRQTFRGPHTVVSSLFLLGELLVIPRRRRDEFSAARVTHLLTAKNVITAEWSSDALPVFVSLRADCGVKPMDALHLVTAATAGVDYFVTNDNRLCRLNIVGIGRILALADALPAF